MVAGSPGGGGDDADGLARARSVPLHACALSHGCFRATDGRGWLEADTQVHGDVMCDSLYQGRKSGAEVPGQGSLPFLCGLCLSRALWDHHGPGNAPVSFFEVKLWH